ncbi:sensor histidine kinase [Nocardia cyriacigeorgica]|uniref:ATP-binding protein n=1 Tax=Nocardia cyriacigeorgica TaxID=135487 RepID=UPI0018947E2E|nr:sensor histidine kinase [Nocardia cyriacigeorgica]MBF6088061.1 sensor histidine kinase [Nocardia cyriacigeorgica]MBF6094021.1 sensor histidine kinase [Nocardia cyriacigeorgica]MBF6396342.1 sensor histidine kinase [Nocardia cyriacigeorgica]MBF6401974.1 sensor histidine kinase [Nocardia cyriacigeorgica]
MNLNIAVLVPWILAPALVLAVAWYAVRAVREQKTRADALERDLGIREEILERFATTTLPSLTESVRRHEQPAGIVEVPEGLEDSRFAQIMRWVSERIAEDMRGIQTETRDTAVREAEEQTHRAITAAEASVRAEEAAKREKAETAAREATSAAVRSFGTSVVSLGADVSQVVSAALREHRDDDVYETLIRIDHTVQQMIRQAQSYVIVCGGLPGRRWPAQSLTDVVGGAIGRVRDFLRVRSGQLDRVVISRSVEPLVHTLAALIDNALRYSPPTSYVDVSFQEGHHGVTVIVDDAGVRMNAEQMEEARQVLAHERSVDIHQLGPAPKVGFPGIAALARRYGFTVYIDGPNAYGGMRAMVYIPESLLVSPRAPQVGESAPVAAGPSSAPAALPSGPAAAVLHGESAPAGARIRESAPLAAVTSMPAATTGQSPAVRSTTLGSAAGSGTTESPMRSTLTGGNAMTGLSDVPDTDDRPTMTDVTTGGLPKRRRRAVAVVPPVAAHSSNTEPGKPRPEIAAAWQSGSKSGRAAATDDTEGMTS